MKKYREIAKEVSKRYLKIPNLVGIILIGSSTHGIDDEFTDIDIQLVVNKKDKSFKMEQFKEEGIKVEVDKMNFNWLMKKSNPDSEQYWIREKAVILYDPKGVLKKGFKKANFLTDKKHKKILWQVYKEIFNKYNANKCLARKEKIAVCMCIFKTIDALSKFIFLYRKKAVPTFRWRWHFIKKEKLLDMSIIKRLISINLNSLEANIKVLGKIEEKAKKMMIKKGYEQERVDEPWRF